MKIRLDHSQKKKINGIIKAWKPEQITQEVFREIQKKMGVPARSIEIIFWQMDILEMLSDSNWLIFKGGTCIQSYLPYDLQRASVDLDFNSKQQNPNSILQEIDMINEKLKRTGRTVIIEDVVFGNMVFIYNDTRSGTLNFVRRMPSKFGEFEITPDGGKVQSKNVRIQINYRHSWLPCIRSVKKEFNPFILRYQKPDTTVEVCHSSPEDILVDKILATSNIGPFGRERYKDVYDLLMLSDLEMDDGLVMEKLKLISKDAGLTTRSVLQASIETISRFESNSLKSRGFSTMVCSGGRRKIDDWAVSCARVIGRIETLIEY